MAWRQLHNRGICLQKRLPRVFGEHYRKSNYQGVAAERPKSVTSRNIEKQLIEVYKELSLDQGGHQIMLEPCCKAPHAFRSSLSPGGRAFFGRK